MTIRSRIAGLGGYLPETVRSNDDMAKIVETSDEWIVDRTGIRQRHFADEKTMTSDLAIHAAQNALKAAGLTGADIDVIVLGSVTPDRTFPATAAYVQAAIGMTGGCAFDLSAACSGFLYALKTADNMVRLGQAKNALVIGVETLSKITDFTDRNTCVLFGDGAGAAGLQAHEGEDGVIDTLIRSDGRHAPDLYATGGPSFNHEVGYITMNGREVFRHASVNMADISAEVLAKNGYTVDDVDWFVPHQANIRIMDAVAKRLGMPAEKVLTTVDKHANTSAASIPLALADGVERGLLKKGQLILSPAMGAGFTWGASLIRL